MTNDHRLPEMRVVWCDAETGTLVPIEYEGEQLNLDALPAATRARFVKFVAEALVDGMSKSVHTHHASSSELGTAESMAKTMEDATATRGRFKSARRLEKEPPTDRQRHLHDPVVHVSTADRDEQQVASLSELQAVVQQENAEQAGASQEPSGGTDQQTPLTLAAWAAQHAAAQGTTVEDVTQAALEEYARQRGYTPPPSRERSQ